MRVLILISVLSLLAACAKKHDEPRAEFGGQTPENFYYSFSTRPTNCGEAEPKLLHQGLFFANHQYFDLSSDDELSIHFYMIGINYRIDFEKTHYRYGGRNTFFKSGSTTTESISGVWVLEDKDMVLYSHEKVVITFKDGLPDNDGYETVYGKFTEDAAGMLSSIDIKPILKELIRSYPIWEPLKENATKACSGNVREVVKL